MIKFLFKILLPFFLLTTIAYSEVIEKIIVKGNNRVNYKKFQKYKKIKPKNVKDIYRLRDYVSSKMDSLGI